MQQRVAQAHAQAQAQARVHVEAEAATRAKAEALLQAQARARLHAQLYSQERVRAEALAQLQAQHGQRPQRIHQVPVPVIDQNNPFFPGYNPAMGGQPGIYNPHAVGKLQQPPQLLPQNVAQYRGVQHRARPQQQVNPPQVEAVRAANVRAALRQPIGQGDGMVIQRVAQQAVNGGNAQLPRRR